jgi:hypothetical protein
MITLKRLRAYTTIIAIVLWSIFIIDFSVAGPVDRLGKVKGTDFLHFYTLGSIVHEGRWAELYDVRALYARAQALTNSPETLYVPIESPQLALLYAPLADHPYTVALFVWLLVTAALYAGCCFAMWRVCEELRPYGYVIAAACVSFPGLYILVLNGQTSSLSLACIVVALLALRQEHQFAGGLALGCLIFKPHWMLAVVAVFLMARDWRVVSGAIAGALAQLALTWALVGSSVMHAYWRMLRALPRIADLLEPKPGDSLRSLFGALIPSERAGLVFYVIACVVAGVIAAKIWRSGAPFEIRFSAVLLASALINPHVNAYDLIVLAPVYFLLANWLARESGDEPQPLPALLCSLFLAPVLDGALTVVRLQFSVVFTLALLLLLWRRSNSMHEMPRSASRLAGVAVDSTATAFSAASKCETAG